MSSSADTLESFLDYMERNDVDDNRIYAHLSRIDIPRLQLLLSRLARVENIAAPKKGRKAFEGKRAALKGKIYEQIVGVFWRAFVALRVGTMSIVPPMS